MKRRKQSSLSVSSQCGYVKPNQGFGGVIVTGVMNPCTREKGHQGPHNSQRGIEVRPNEFIRTATQKDKQEYYCYDEHPLRFKYAPTLDRGLVDAMRQKGFDKNYRFVWGGVVLVRTEPNGASFELARGSRDGLTEFNGIMVPKYIYMRTRQARGLFYIDDLNRRVVITNADLAPVGKIVQVDYRYVDFGILRWFFEYRADASTLIEARVYDSKSAVPNEEWVTISRLSTNNGLYYEPGMEMIDIIAKREWENNNRSLKEVGKELIAKLAKAREENERKEELAAKAEFDRLHSDVENRIGQVHFT